MTNEKTISLNLYNGSLLFVDTVLQDPRPCDTPPKMVKWAQAYQFLQNNFQKSFSFKDQTDTYENHRNAILLSYPADILTTSDANLRRKFDLDLLHLEKVFSEWANKEITFALPVTIFDTIKNALTFRITHQDSSKNLVFPINIYTIKLLTEFGIE